MMPLEDRPGKIFVGGLDFDIDEDEFEKMFGKFGKITEVLLKRDQQTNKSRGFGFITYENPSDADEAVKVLDKKSVVEEEVTVMTMEGIAVVEEGSGVEEVIVGAVDSAGAGGTEGAEDSVGAAAATAAEDLMTAPIRKSSFDRSYSDRPMRREEDRDRYGGGLDRDRDLGSYRDYLTRDLSPPPRDYLTSRERLSSRDLGLSSRSFDLGRDPLSSREYRSSRDDFMPSSSRDFLTRDSPPRFRDSGRSLSRDYDRITRDLDLHRDRLTSGLTRGYGDYVILRNMLEYIFDSCRYSEKSAQEQTEGYGSVKLAGFRSLILVPSPKRSGILSVNSLDDGFGQEQAKDH
ncbi:RBMX-like protein [Mya arenaria]|uniref:RBMX-like protein n=1 Tax=Mya arenaria TaxID=6604 RepID=A0ABY7G035_MYAAR|nr:RBMX-like protein [Mya arenaria]